jgi:hypothetical protein
MALEALAGSCVRGRDPLYHLWHPPAPRDSRRIGSDANAALERRYIVAMRSDQQMRELVSEVTG